jgi:5-formyltetrahydrofolate cyclo-ligase
LRYAELPLNQIPRHKQNLRSEIKKRLAVLSPGDFTAQGEAAAALFRESPLWARYETLLLFLSLPEEIDTRPLLELALQSGKRVFAPRVTGRGELRFHRVLSAAGPWTEGPFGIREPPDAELPPAAPSAGGPATGSPAAGPVRGEALAPADSPALVIVPGLAFDIHGRRLGRGGGCYDRFLASPEFRGTPETAESTGPLQSRLPRAIGLCMPLQILPEIPAEPWDKKMDGLCTGERFFRIPRT